MSADWFDYHIDIVIIWTKHFSLSSISHSTRLSDSYSFLSNNRRMKCSNLVFAKKSRTRKRERENTQKFAFIYERGERKNIQQQQPWAWIISRLVEHSLVWHSLCQESARLQIHTGAGCGLCNQTVSDLMARFAWAWFIELRLECLSFHD